MILLFTRLFGDRITEFCLNALTHLIDTALGVLGVYIMLALFFAIILSSVIKVTWNFGGLTSMIGTFGVFFIIGILMLKLIIVTGVIGTPLIILAAFIYRKMKEHRVDPSLRALALWAMILVII